MITTAGKEKTNDDERLLDRERGEEKGIDTV